VLIVLGSGVGRVGRENVEVCVAEVVERARVVWKLQEIFLKPADVTLVLFAWGNMYACVWVGG
jgi:hypothetical protein